MSAKILSSLSDENRDCNKQYGCMNGIFQLFDRHYFINGRRISSNHKRLLPVPGTEHGIERKTAPGNRMEKNEDIIKDEQRVSIESPRKVSSSSSRASTLPLSNHMVIEGARPPRLISQSYNLDNSTQVARKQTRSSRYSDHQANDVPNAVNNLSTQKEQSGLSVKTAIKEGRGHAMKHIDSPRPSQPSKSSYSRITGSDGSTSALAKIQGSPRNSMELKDTPSRFSRKDSPRFSLDGRETQDASKTATKLKEFPRLSLDSRESRLNHFPRDLRRDNICRIGENEEPGSNKRPSNLVVKLMGLENFPDSSSESEAQIFKPRSSLDQDFESSSTKRYNKIEQHRSVCQNDLQKDPASPSLRNGISSMKQTSGSKFPLEKAPCRQHDDAYYPPKTEAKITASVYGEIEKRISELEFKKSGKDLRALKQILEAIQKTRKKSEEQQEEQSELKAQLEPETDQCRSSSSLCNRISEASNCQRSRSNNVIHAKDPSSPKNIKYSTTRRKQPSTFDNGRNSTFTQIATDDTSHLLNYQKRTTACVGENLPVKVALKDETPRNNTFKDPALCRSLLHKQGVNNALKPVRTSRAPQVLMTEKHTPFERSPSAPRPIHKTNQHQTCTPPIVIPFIEAGKVRKRSSRKPTTKVRPTCNHPQRSKSKTNSYTDINSFAQTDDSASVQSESNSSASQTESEVTSMESPLKIVPKQHIYSRERNIAARLYEDKPLPELTVTTEQPSPVSVLDAAFYAEDSPSPVKKMAITFPDFETSESDEAELGLDGLNLTSSIAKSNHHDEFSKRESVHLKHLIYSTRVPTVTADAASRDLIGSLHRKSSFDYDYIAKILSASGLLRNLGQILTTTRNQLSGQLINPDLFHVLEQTTHNVRTENDNVRFAAPKCNQKIHRRMLFDTVNEITVRKLTSESPFTMRKRIKTEQELFREIILEMDSLQAKSDCCLDDPDELGNILNADMKREAGDWAENQREIPAVVLDIERLIFKDLITEVLNGGNLGQHDIPRKQQKL